jgi:hypothetical protein
MIAPEEKSKMRLPAALLAACLLGGCAGYAADYFVPEIDIIGPQLTRYGLDETQARCVTERLAQTLSVWQLRQLQRVARLVPQGHFGPGPLSIRDLITVASHVEDRAVRPELEAAATHCRIGAEPAGGVTRVDSLPTPQPPGAAASAVGRSLWLNLGAAGSGQSIAVDASSIAESEGHRQAWFRLTDPGAARPSERSYLLRIDCAGRTINALAFRRHGPEGEVVEEAPYGPNGEGVRPIEGGTVLEIAFLAVCT